MIRSVYHQRVYSVGICRIFQTKCCIHDDQAADFERAVDSRDGTVAKGAGGTLSLGTNGRAKRARFFICTMPFSRGPPLVLTDDGFRSRPFLEAISL